MSPNVPVVHVTGRDYGYPAAGQQSGVHIVTGPYGQATRPHGFGTDVLNGGHVWLFNGPRMLACSIAAAGYDRYDAAMAAEVAEIQPWAHSISHLDQAGQLGDRAMSLGILMQADEIGDRDRWAEQVLAYALRAELPTGPDSRSLLPADRARHAGPRAAARLAAAEREQRDAAARALPPAHLDLPVLTDSWTPWQWPEDPWRDELARLVYWRYRTQQPDTAARNRVIRWAIDSGLPKAELHRGTGVSRATIDRVLADH